MVTRRVPKTAAIAGHQSGSMLSPTAWAGRNRRCPGFTTWSRYQNIRTGRSPKFKFVALKRIASATLEHIYGPNPQQSSLMPTRPTLIPYRSLRDPRERRLERHAQALPGAGAHRLQRDASAVIAFLLMAMTP